MPFLSYFDAIFLASPISATPNGFFRMLVQLDTTECRYLSVKSRLRWPVLAAP